MQFDKYYLLDTNILLEDAKNIFKLADDSKNLIVLPETVLDEIDTKKGGFEEINFQAREFARILEDFDIIEIKEVENYTITRVKVIAQESVIIDIISKKEYIQTSKNSSLNIINDRKILEIASFAKQFYKNDVIFLSLDVMARIRAISLNISTNSLVGSKNRVLKNEFIKRVEIDFDQLGSLENEDIRKFDENYERDNFSYCFKVKSSDHIVLANIQNEKIRVLDETEVRNQTVTPLNTEQLFFSNAINSMFYNVLIVEAKAGSGKTLLALSGALKLVRKKFYRKVIYIRNSIESLDKGEDVGYLPGLEEKFAIYNHPLMDSLEHIIRSEHKKKAQSKKTQAYQELDEEEMKQRIEQRIENYSIETMWVGEMRGRTLSDSFVIIDEAQNMSNKTMQMVLSRIDNSCKVVILGSNKQIDNFYVNKHTNSLTTLLKSTKDNQTQVNIFAIELEKVLRGPITEWAETIFNPQENK